LGGSIFPEIGKLITCGNIGGRWVEIGKLITCGNIEIGGIFDEIGKFFSGCVIFLGEIVKLIMMITLTCIIVIIPI
jgi:hypothetical protein